MKSRTKLVVGILVIVAVAGSAVYSVRKARKPAPLPRFAVAAIEDLKDTVTETGVVEPIDKIDVKSKVAGKLLSIPITEGQSVVTGQLIAEVDRSVIDPQMARAQSQLDQAKAKLAQAIATYNLQIKQDAVSITEAQAAVTTAMAHREAVKAAARPQEVSQQQESVSRADIALADAERTLNRKRALLAKGFVSQSEVDATQMAVDTARSSVAAARSALSLTKAGPRTEDIADATAQVESARAQLAGARVNAEQHRIRRYDIDQASAAVQGSEHDLAQLQVSLNDTRIVAPAAGVVLKKYKEQNEIVQSATTGYSDAQAILTTLGRGARVRVNINEVDIAKLAIGQKVSVTVDALPGVTLAGRVSEIAPATSGALADTSTADASTSIAKFIVRIALVKPDSRVRPGMSAGVTVTARERHAVLALPSEIAPDGGATAIVKVLTGPANRQVTHTIKLGLRTDSRVEVLSGLKAGDRVVIPTKANADRRKIDIYN
ncbi:MAG TPA: HlyD family efflux transporter periplasmic adaptor subunit [Capsulimonadaceae bacterium]|jgi:multidrug efflux pump subunit AcrA (membrane-fusion protein)